MTLSARIAVLSGLALALGAAEASASPKVFVYQVEHPTYGNIGTYTNTIDQKGDSVDIQTQLHVSVKVLGISMFKQDATRSEHWEKGRLVAFQGGTDDNGKQIDIAGRAQGDSFVVNSPLGTFTAPAKVHPSNPWTVQCLDTDVMMSTKTGRIMNVKVTDTGEANVSFDGQTVKAHQYFIDGEKHQVVWINDLGVVVGFQTEEAGSQITFFLQNDTPSRAVAGMPPMTVSQAAYSQ